jgi:sn-glycerol 3-phosphate transport system substrate-binding protein
MTAPNRRTAVAMLAVMTLPLVGGVVVAGTPATAATKVEFWHTFGDAKRSGWIADRAADYNKAHPESEVVAVFKGDSNQVLQSTILSGRQGKPPALVQVEGVSSQLAVDSGVFKPVGDVSKVSFSDYLDPIISYYTINGKVNSIPFNSSSPVLYFNKSLMAKAGLDPAKPPTTFDEIFTTCATFTAAKTGARCLALTPYSWLFEQWMSEQNASLVNNDNGRKARATSNNINSAAGRQVLSFYQELNKRGYLTNTGKLADTVGTNAIFTGQKAMMTINSTAGLGNISDGAKQSGFDLGVGTFPVPTAKAKNGVVIGGASLWVSKGVSDDEATVGVDFAEFLTNTENMVSWHKLTGYYPVRKSSVDALQKEGWFDSNPLQVVAFKQLLDTKPNVANAGALNGANIEVRNVIEQSMQKVLDGQSVATVAKTASIQADKVIADYNKNFS